MSRGVNMDRKAYYDACYARMTHIKEVLSDAGFKVSELELGMLSVDIGENKVRRFYALFSFPVKENTSGPVVDIEKIIMEGMSEMHREFRDYIHSCHATFYDVNCENVLGKINHLRAILKDDYPDVTFC